MTKSVMHTVPLGSTTQVFHFKYLDSDGKVQSPYMDFAQEAHKELHCLQKHQTYESDEIWDALKPYKQRRILGIQKALRGLENGTFTFCCEEMTCNHHPDNDGNCDASLTIEKTRAKPEACNCAEYRETHCCDDDPVRVLRLVATIK